MHPITEVHYLALSAALLLIGTIGVLTRRNIVIILMSIELILNAVNINLVAFSHALRRDQRADFRHLCDCRRRG
jgi:NADH-quinone oxidoreductase subunit K